MEPNIDVLLLSKDHDSMEILRRLDDIIENIESNIGPMNDRILLLQTLEKLNKWKSKI